MDVVGRATGELFAPRSDRGDSQPVDTDRPERVNGVLEPVAQRLDRDVLGDEDSQRRRLAPTGVRQLLLPERLGERRSRLSLRAEPAALRPRPVQGPEPIRPASLELVYLAR